MATSQTIRDSLPVRNRRRIVDITFTETGDGAVGTLTLGTVTGEILVESICARCSTTLVGAATIEVGVASDTAALIAQIADATNLVANELWISASPTGRVETAVVNKVVGDDIILTIGSTALTAGVIKMLIEWRPITDDGNMT